MTKTTHKYVGGFLGLFLLGIAGHAGLQISRNLKDRQKKIRAGFDTLMRYSRRDVARLDRQLADFSLAE
jgi:hypothetical protein